jgi:hypothetical protein
MNEVRGDQQNSNLCSSSRRVDRLEPFYRCIGQIKPCWMRIWLQSVAAARPIQSCPRASARTPSMYGITCSLHDGFLPTKVRKTPWNCRHWHNPVHTRSVRRHIPNFVNGIPPAPEQLWTAPRAAKKRRYYSRLPQTARSCLGSILTGRGIRFLGRKAPRIRSLSSPQISGLKAV